MSCFLWEKRLSQLFGHCFEIRGFWGSSSNDWYLKWNILLQCIKNCSAARTGKSLVTPLHAGEKANWVIRNSIRGTEEQNEEGKRKTHEGRNSVHAPQGPPAALTPAQGWALRTNTSVSPRQRSPTPWAPTSTGSWLLPFLQTDANPHKSKSGSWSSDYSIYFSSFELFISALHRTFPFNRGNSCRKKSLRRMAGMASCGTVASGVRAKANWSYIHDFTSLELVFLYSWNPIFFLPFFFLTTAWTNSYSHLSFSWVS